MVTPTLYMIGTEIRIKGVSSVRCESSVKSADKRVSESLSAILL